MGLLGGGSLGFLGLVALVAAEEPDDNEGGGNEEHGVDDYASYATLWKDRSRLFDEGVAAAEDCVGDECSLASCHRCCWEIGLAGFGVTGCLGAERGRIDRIAAVCG